MEEENFKHALDDAIDEYTILKKPTIVDTVTEEPVETYIVIPPDGGWGWIIVLAAFFSFLISDGIIYSYGIFLNDISKGLLCSKSEAALVGAIMTGTFCCTGPLISALINRFGYRKIAVTGCFVASLSCILTSISPTLCLLFITHGILGGIGFGMIYLPAIVAVGFYFERWRTLAVGIAVCGSGVGGIVLPLVLTTFVDQYGWRYTFRIVAGISFICNIFVILYRRIKPVCVMPEVPQKQEIPAGPIKLSLFSHFHNISYPKVSGIYSKSSYKLNENANSTSKTSIRPTDISVTTLFQHQKFASNISSEFIMSSYPTTSSKSSFRSNRSIKPQTSTTSTKVADSGLSTVYEESINNGCCIAHINQIINKVKCNSKGKQLSSCCAGKLSQDTNEYMVTRPLYRNDIFYSASIVYLPEYQLFIKASAGSKSKSTLEKNLFGTRTIIQRESDENKTACKCCSSEAMKGTLVTMLDFQLLKSPSFLLLLSNAIFTSMGFYTPYMFIQDRAIQNGITENKAVWLIPCIGIMNTLGRIGCGILISFSRIQAVSLTYASLLFGGIVTVFSGMLLDVCIQFSYASIYGLSIASISTLRTIIIVEMLGLEKLTNAFGITLLFQGLAALVGTSFSSFLREFTGNYDMSFYFAGGSIAVGALFLVPIRKVATWEKQKQQNANDDVTKA